MGDLDRTCRAVATLLTEAGFGAKTSSGMGHAKIEKERAYLLLRMPARKKQRFSRLTGNELWDLLFPRAA